MSEYKKHMDEQLRCLCYTGCTLKSCEPTKMYFADPFGLPHGPVYTVETIFEANIHCKSAPKKMYSRLAALLTFFSASQAAFFV